MNWGESILAFKNLLFEAIKSIDVNKAILIRKLFILILLNITLEIMTSLNKNEVVQFVSWIIGSFIYIMLAVITHRIILLGETSVFNQSSFKWTRREFHFASYLFSSTIRLLAISLGPSLFFLAIVWASRVNIPDLFYYVGFILSLWFESRWSLVFPACAIDKEISFASSWQLTNEFQPLMLICLFSFPLLWIVILSFSALLILVISSLFGHLEIVKTILSFLIEHKDHLKTAFGLVFQLLAVILLVFEVVILSVTYRFIMEKTNIQKEESYSA